MHRIGNDGFELLSNKLKLEARRFVKNKQKFTSKNDLIQIVANLTGLRMGAGDEISGSDLEQACKRLQQRLKIERRKSRTMSPLYDSNRHIALHEALKQVSKQLGKQKTPTTGRRVNAVSGL